MVKSYSSFFICHGKISGNVVTDNFLLFSVFFFFRSILTNIPPREKPVNSFQLAVSKNLSSVITLRCHWAIDLFIASFSSSLPCSAILFSFFFVLNLESLKLGYNINLITICSKLSRSGSPKLRPLTITLSLSKNNKYII